MLDGAPGAYRDVAVLNAAAAMVVAGRAKDLTEGVALAQTSLDTGSARARLERLVTLTASLAPEAAQ